MVTPAFYKITVKDHILQFSMLYQISRNYQIPVIKQLKKKLLWKTNLVPRVLSCSSLLSLLSLLGKSRRGPWERGLIRSLSKGVCGRRTSTGSESFSLLIYLDATKCVLVSIFTIIETNCQKIWEKLLPSNAKRPLLVDARRSKTSSLKFLKF